MASLHHHQEASTLALPDLELLRIHFSPRQSEVLFLMMNGYCRSSIADRLNLSVRTVDTVRARILIKMKAKSNAELALKAMQLLQHP